jgi:hypothetical protein
MTSAEFQLLRRTNSTDSEVNDCKQWNFCLASAFSANIRNRYWNLIVPSRAPSPKAEKEKRFEPKSKRAG